MEMKRVSHVIFHLTVFFIKSVNFSSFGPSANFIFFFFFQLFYSFVRGRRLRNKCLIIQKVKQKEKKIKMEMSFYDGFYLEIV